MLKAPSEVEGLRAVLRQAQDRESNRTVSMSNGSWTFYEAVNFEYLAVKRSFEWPFESVESSMGQDILRLGRLAANQSRRMPPFDLLATPLALKGHGVSSAFASVTYNRL